MIQDKKLLAVALSNCVFLSLKNYSHLSQHVSNIQCVFADAAAIIISIIINRLTLLCLSDSVNMNHFIRRTEPCIVYMSNCRREGTPKGRGRHAKICGWPKATDDLQLRKKAIQRFSKLMQRIFKYGDIPDRSLTSDNELNIWIYRTPSYVFIYRSYTVGLYTYKNGPFFDPACKIGKSLKYFLNINVTEVCKKSSNVLEI